jgi:murein DD-endopeptidase MepM/ murein hydrolase activator NlpD
MLDKTFNPYEGTHETAYSDRRIFHATDNPGFATVVQNVTDGISYNGKFYGRPTGLFNEDFTRFHRERGYTLFHHEGLDLRGTIGTPVVSLVHARVLAYGRFGAYGITMILENTTTKGVYLLGHLRGKREGLDLNSIVEPHDVVAYSGNTAAGSSTVAAHLHISYYDFERVGNTNLLNNSNNVLSWNTREWGDDQNPNAWLRDPLNHTVKRMANRRRG